MRAIRGWKTAVLLSGSIATAGLLLGVFLRPSGSPPAAEATFHSARIHEFMVGTTADPTVVYVEIIMLSTGQNLVAGTRLTFFDNGGNADIVVQVPANVLSGTNRRWIMASSSFAAASGISHDFVFDVEGAIQNASGMICWGAPGIFAENPPTWDAANPNNYTDCIVYGGAYIGPPSPPAFSTVTSLAGGDGVMSVTRTNTLQPGAVALACPTPQNNANNIGNFGVCPPVTNTPTPTATLTPTPTPTITPIPTSTPTPCSAGPTNYDGQPLDNGLNLAGDEVTILFGGDSHPDDCDADDDNDGLDDAVEVPGPPCLSALAATDPLDMDSDGDHLTDGWECANGSNPNDASSKFLGVAAGDTDGDNIEDLWERRGYNANAGAGDSDGDGCWDMVEIGSVDGNLNVGIVDRLAVARRSLNIAPYNVPDAAQDYVFDIDKNGSVGIADRLFVARASLLGPPWEPKSCP